MLEFAAAAAVDDDNGIAGTGVLMDDVEKVELEGLLILFDEWADPLALPPMDAFNAATLPNTLEEGGVTGTGGIDGAEVDALGDGDDVVAVFVVTPAVELELGRGGKAGGGMGGAESL